ncbi:substrate-binding domain-containing protein [candidate division KSB3 bacterium]|uniref:Substrate-binding domain-containing protein n=1 Tax=candidate division KSB3 bacterium TaxID=2044937 RepID=A0A9D5JUI4_9BACT|nr:substrate-binding domain-containing protein [candidate division KSB3 bacterium]MBD3324410.1 substrate-binding domain-containing protein [candidate division KSB3 bacterium]
MKKACLIAMVTMMVFGLTVSGSFAQEKPGEGLVIYAQMGGNSGDPSTLPRENGAQAAEEFWGCDVNYQYSGWQPDVMIAQFKEAMAANPDGIVIMGHPGVEAFKPFVEEAIAKGIIVTSNNTPLTEIEAKYKADGFGYVGMDLFESGYLLGKSLAEYAGLQEGDKVFLYGLMAQPERGKMERGSKQAWEDLGLIVDYIEITPEVDKDASMAIPVITGYLASNPDCKAIIASHGNVTSIMEEALKAAGKGPDEVAVGGYDLSAKTVASLQSRFLDVVLDQQLYLQGYIPIEQICLTKLYKFAGLNMNTGAGVVTPETIDELIPLIEQGIR